MGSKSRSKSSKAWLERQHSDPYTQLAKQQGYRSRAAFKLLEIQQKDNIIQPGMRVVDLGAAPGGWSQVVCQILKGRGRLIAVDLLPIEPLPAVDIVEGDFEEQAVLETILTRLEAQKVDLVISDMAPNLSGITLVDQSRALYLVELAVSFADTVLKEGGTLLVKAFQGEGFQSLWSMLKKQFRQVVIRKPKSSRSESREIYLLAKGFILTAKDF